MRQIFPSRISLSFVAALFAAAVVYMFIAWGIFPKPSGDMLPALKVGGWLAIVMMVGGWLLLFLKRPEWRKMQIKFEKQNPGQDLPPEIAEKAKEAEGKK
ncbi:MAG: hypothetical protein ACPGO3_04545 [Magnetospiraceae bacterium]